MATQVTALRTMLEADSVQKQFYNALKENKDAFTASIIDVYSGDKALQSCDPRAVIQEALKAAVLKLPINKALGFSYIVVYNNARRTPSGQWEKTPTPTFILGYKGYIQMAMRTGQYRTINADTVYEGELRGVDKLTGEIRFDGEKISDRVVGYFAHFELLNGFRKTLYMSVREMAAYAKRYSPSVRSETTVEKLIEKAQEDAVGKKPGWEGNFETMALKTVIRRLLSKYGYLSIEMQNAMAEENGGETAARSAREEMINAPTTEINLDEASYEEVRDTPQAPPAVTAAPDEQESPDY